MKKESRKFDLILWGATSFVGKIIAEYLLERLSELPDFRWALGARNPDKVAQLQSELGSELPVFVGDSFDRSFLEEMVSQTSVILSTVGPYMKYGESLVAACALKGTDYCDLTGEVGFVQKMVDQYEDRARESGARLVNCAGFDSLPSDLGVLHLNDYCDRVLGSPLHTVEMQVRAAKGGVSGGTVASGIETVAQLQKDPGLKSVLANPYAMCPEGMRSGVRQPSLSAAKRSEFNGDWLHDFVMAPVNTKVVHASNARLDYPYGEDFTYSEWQVANSALMAYLGRFGVGAAMLALYFPWTRALLQRFVLPEPGEGPDRKTREQGYFALLFCGVTRAGKTVTCRVTGDADPGYGSTAKQISEVAIGLATSLPLIEKSGGFWTPASSLGLKLKEPLTKYAGLKFETPVEGLTPRPA